MKVNSPVQGQTNLSSRTMQYFQPASPDMSPIVSGLNSLAAGIESATSKSKADKEQLDRFKLSQRVVEFDTDTQLKMQELKKSAAPDDANFAERGTNSYLNYESEFLNTVPEEFREEVRTKLAATRQKTVLDVNEFQDNNLRTYYKDEIGKTQSKEVEKVVADPKNLAEAKANLDALIDATNYSEQEKYYLKQDNAKFLEKAGYAETVKREKLSNVQYSNDLVEAAKQAADELGLPVEDWLTIISYETIGTFSTKVRGGTDNKHIGLIQFGEDEQKEFGAYQGQSVGEQMKAAVRYMKNRGFKPGMGILEAYSTINAGQPGRLGTTDENNGGAPGTVREKVEQQMAGHRAKARALLGGKYQIEDDIDSDPQFSNVPYEDRVAIRKDTDAAVNSMLAEMETQRKNDAAARANSLFVALRSGQAGRADVDQMISDGLLPDYDDQNKADGILKEREKEGESLRYGQQKMAAGGMFEQDNPDDKNGLNALFKASGGTEQLVARNSDYVSNTLIPLVQKGGLIPSDAISTFRAMQSSLDGRNKLFANQALSILENTNPGLYNSQVPENVKKVADLWETYNGKVPEMQLLEMLSEAPTQEQRTAREFFREEAKKFLTSPGQANYVSFDTVKSEFGNPPGIAWATKSMEMEWQSLLIENYARSGNWELAQEMTTKQLKRVWAKSDVAGGVVMRNPPESVLPIVAGSHDWAKVQLRGELGLKDDEEVQLLTDARTQLEIEKGQNPSWIITIKKDGVWYPAKNANGEPLRQVFKPQEQDRTAHNAYVKLNNKKAELSYWATKDNGLIGVETPKEVTDNIARLQSEIEALEPQTKVQQKKAEQQYETPAGLAVKQLEESVTELQAKFDASGLTVEDWYATDDGKKHGAALEELEKQQKIAEEELKVKRSAVDEVK